MLTKLYKILSLIFTSLFLISTVNSSDQIVVDYEGFCPNYPITFTLYNKTQFDDKDRIEKRLCEENEDPEEDKCDEWEEFDMEIKIFNGPIDGLPILKEISLNNEREFSFSFPSQNQYLIKFELTGDTEDDYNGTGNLEELIEIHECRFSENNKDNYPETNEPEQEQLENITLEYPENKLKLTLENTKIKSQEQIQVELINPKNENLPVLDNEIQTIKLNSNETEFTNLEIEIELNLQQNQETKIYQLNNGNWIEFNPKPQIIGNTIIFDVIEMGYYSIQQKEIIELPPIEETPIDDNQQQNDNTNENINNNQNSNSQENTPVQLNLDPEGKSFDIKILIAAVVIIAGIVAYLFIPKKKEQDWNYHDHRNPINNETYTKTKQYVQKYKATYNQEQIKQALINAKIDEQVINKVLKEEFTEQK